MTERPVDVAQAQTAQTAGEAAAAKHLRDTEAMQSNIAGSEVWVEPALTVDDIAAASIGTSATPPAVSPPTTSSPNVADPLDVSQSQP